MPSTTLHVRVQPRASRNEVVRQEGDAWWVRLAAPPVEGKANAALAVFLAEVLSIPKSRIAIVRGLSGRQKAVVIEGLSETQVQRRMREAMGESG